MKRSDLNKMVKKAVFNFEEGVFHQDGVRYVNYYDPISKYSFQLEEVKGVYCVAPPSDGSVPPKFDKVWREFEKE